MTKLAPETLLIGGYATFLLVAAFALDRLARVSHARSERYRTAGFTYHPHLDAWECPAGERLALVEHDRHRRIAFYRAPAASCNRCALKRACTDSDQGREIRRALDPWPHSEAGRFHRGISVVLVALAAVIVAVAIGFNPRPPDLVVLAPLLAIVLAVLTRLGAAFAATPSGFPDGAATRAKAMPTTVDGGGR
jgi:hypothetical protein